MSSGSRSFLGQGMSRARLRSWHQGRSYITLNVENIDMFVEYLIAPLPAMWTDAEKTREEYFLR